LHEFFVNEFMNPTTTSAQLELEFEEKEQEVIEVEAEELVDLQEFGNYGVVFN